jgi:hypothetical protein
VEEVLHFCAHFWFVFRFISFSLRGTFSHLLEIMYIWGVGQRAAGLVLVRHWSNLLLRIPPYFSSNFK